jgi:hypothetical protein
MGLLPYLIMALIVFGMGLVLHLLRAPETKEKQK